MAKKTSPDPAQHPIDGYNLYPPEDHRQQEARLQFDIAFAPERRRQIHLRTLALYHLIGDALFALLDNVLLSERYVETVNDPDRAAGRYPRRSPLLRFGGASALPALVRILPRLLYPDGKPPRYSTPLYSPTVLNILRDASRDPALFADALEQIARALRPPARVGKGRRRSALTDFERRQAVLELRFCRYLLRMARRHPEKYVHQLKALRLAEALALGHDANTTAAVLAFARLHGHAGPLSEIDAEEALRYLDSARKATKRPGGKKRLLSPSTTRGTTTKIPPSGAESANSAGRKRDPHDAEAQPQPPRPQQAEARRSAPRLPSGRPPAPRRDQPERPPEHDRRGSPPSHPARPRRPRPGG